jgi:hypothetical protein
MNGDLFDRAPVVSSAFGAKGRWRSLGEVLAPIVKHLALEGALGGAIPKDVANRIIGSRWLRGA